MIYGLEKEGLYIGGMPDDYPEWLQVFRTERKNPKPGKKPYVESLVCNDIPTMMFMVNNWCVDFHASNATTDDPANPDYIVIDLDPTIPDFAKATDVPFKGKRSKTSVLSCVQSLAALRLEQLLLLRTPRKNGEKNIIRQSCIEHQQW